MNIIIAKPAYQDVDLSQIQVKTLIYEKLSAKIILEDPKVENSNLFLNGKIIDPAVRKVHINVHALVEDRIKKETIYPKTLIDKDIKVNKDGTFTIKVPLGEKRELYIIKSPPIITVSSDADVASKTLIKWYPN